MKKQIFTTALACTIGFSSFVVPTVIQPIETVAAYENNTQAVEAKANALIQTAKSLIGKATYNTTYKPTAPYQFTCATFMMYIFEKNGVDLATYNEDYMIQQGSYVAREDLQKGDLVFFRSSKTSSVPNHVGMYIGNNEIIHMADSKQHIVISDLNSKPYYTENYMTARRVLPTLMSANPKTAGDSVVETAYNNKDSVKIASTNNEASKQFTAAGFVEYVFRKSGKSLGTTSMTELMKQGTTVSKANLQKGDLVFFNSTTGSKTPSTVAIYAGDHRLIIPTSSGVITRVMLVDYYQEHFITAKRVLTTTATTSQTTTTAATSQTTTGAKIATTATSLMGKAKFGYVYNEQTLTFTSAGFTYYVFKQHGIDLKTKLASSQASLGTSVSKANLQTGDLLLFSDNGQGSITQTAIYIGNQQYIMMKTNGTVVKQHINSTWSTQNFMGARRVN